MKLSTRDAARFFANPDPACPGILIYGPDAMRVALKRQDLISRLLGPDGEAEMRLDRIAAGELRKDATLVNDALKARGFFPGQRVCFVEDTSDGLADTIGDALAQWTDGDAFLLVTSGGLNARAKLRKLFEAHPKALALGIYDDPPTRAETDAAITRAGFQDIAPDASQALHGYAQTLDPGDFRQFLEKLSLYKIGDATALSSADVEACAPLSLEAGLDDLVHVVADNDPAAIGPLMQRLTAQGVNPVSLCIATLRHFRTLHAAASDPGGPGKALSRARPPVFGPKRDRMERQARRWGADNLDRALHMLIDTDLTLRSSSPAPAMAVMERTLIRLTRLVR